MSALLLSAMLGATPSTIDLVDFSHTSMQWSANNDPVMGGRSTSRVALEAGLLNFTGVCAIVPSLKAPGFITAVTGSFWHPAKFSDVSSCQGLAFTAKDFTSGYTGYRISFGTAKPPGGKFFATGYKANLSPTVGSFGTVHIPFTNFTDFWDDATGDPIHTCAEKAAYCPDAKTLKDMRTMSIWAEGVQGTIHLEVKSIAAYGCN